ncbi:hypothetical protein FRB99_004038, partial [Tulasnella sp. 403]
MHTAILFYVILQAIVAFAAVKDDRPCTRSILCVREAELSTVELHRRFKLVYTMVTVNEEAEKILPGDGYRYDEDALKFLIGASQKTLFMRDVGETSVAKLSLWLARVHAAKDDPWQQEYLR